MNGLDSGDISTTLFVAYTVTALLVVVILFGLFALSGITVLALAEGLAWR